MLHPIRRSSAARARTWWRRQITGPLDGMYDRLDEHQREVDEDQGLGGPGPDRG